MNYNKIRKNKLVQYYALFVLLLVICIGVQGCYSLKGTSIPPEVKTFYVENFSLSAPSAPGAIHLDFTTRLQDKVEQESRLRYNDDTPDIEFSGSVTRYRVSSEAAGANNEADFEKLTIDVKVIYVDNLNEENNWERVFSFFRDFGADQSLVDNEDEFVSDIFDQLTENIFNHAFSNW